MTKYAKHLKAYNIRTGQVEEVDPYDSEANQRIDDFINDVITDSDIDDITEEKSNG